jgi:hypothetical protein
VRDLVNTIRGIYQYPRNCHAIRFHVSCRSCICTQVFICVPLGSPLTLHVGLALGSLRHIMRTMIPAAFECPLLPRSTTPPILFRGISASRNSDKRRVDCNRHRHCCTLKDEEGRACHDRPPFATGKPEDAMLPAAATT